MTEITAPLQTVSPKKSFNWKNILIGVMIGVILIGLGVGVYFLIHKLTTPTLYTTSKTATTSAKKDGTVNWKTYKNKYFSFKYPSNWFYESPSWLPAEENVSFFVVGTKADHSDGDHKGNEVFNFAFGASGDTIDKIKKDYYPNAKDITVAGRKAIKVSEVHVVLSISSDITVNVSGQNLDKILSTLKVFDEETADGRVYTNREYSFEIKYPADFFLKDLTTLGKEKLIVEFAAKEYEDQTVHNPAVYLYVIEKSDLSLDDWLDKNGTTIDLLKEPGNFRYYGVSNKEDTTIDNTQAIKFGHWKVSGGGDSVIFKNKSGFLFEIHRENSGMGDFPVDIFDQMLSTFKFLSSTSSE